MSSVYVLESQKTGKYYVGYTADIEKRLRYHNSGKNKSTKNEMPWIIVYQETYGTKKEA